MQVQKTTLYGTPSIMLRMGKQQGNDPIWEKIQTNNPVRVNEAFKDLDEYLRKIYSLKNLQPAELEDIIQDTLLIVHKQLQGKRFKGNSNIKTWVTRIAFNVRNQLSEKKGHKGYTHPVEISEPRQKIRISNTPKSPLDSDIEAEGNNIFMQARKRLDLQQQAVLRQVLDGKTGPEGAKALGITLPNFKSTLHRGKNVLRADSELIKYRNS